MRVVYNICDSHNIVAQCIYSDNLEHSTRSEINYRDSHVIKLYSHWGFSQNLTPTDFRAIQDTLQHAIRMKNRSESVATPFDNKPRNLKVIRMLF